MNARVLFAISMVEEDFYNLRNIKEQVQAEYPSYYYQVRDQEIRERPPILNSLTVPPMRFGNVSGHWLASNISSESNVIDEPMTVDVLKRELARERYTHICISAFLDGYEQFQRCMEYLIRDHPQIARAGQYWRALSAVSPVFSPEKRVRGGRRPVLA